MGVYNGTPQSGSYSKDYGNKDRGEPINLNTIALIKVLDLVDDANYQRSEYKDLPTQEDLRAFFNKK